MSSLSDFDMDKLQNCTQNQIRTVSWDDIKPNAYGLPTAPAVAPQHIAHDDSTSSSSKEQHRYFDSDFDWEHLDGIDVDAVLDDIERIEQELATATNTTNTLNLSTVTDHEWNVTIESLRRSIRNNKRSALRVSLIDNAQRPPIKPRPQRMDMGKMKKMEKLLEEIGGESLCEMVLKYEKQKTTKRIMERLESAAEQKVDEVRFVESLKSVEIVDDLHDDGHYNDNDDDSGFWAKYGIRCRLTMDLDFDETVTENEQFGEQMTEEIASILGVDESLIRIDSTERGSVIVTVTLCAIGAVFLFFAGWSMDRVSFTIKRKWGQKGRGDGGEMLLAVDPGDEVFVDWKDQQYVARVLEKKQSADDGWITVHYVDDPFMFQNTETLALSSSRLHLKEPGSTHLAHLYPDEGGNVAIEVEPVN